MSSLFITNSKTFSKLHVSFCWIIGGPHNFFTEPEPAAAVVFAFSLRGAKRFVLDPRFDISAGASQHLGGQVADGALGCRAARVGGETQVGDGVDKNSPAWLSFLFLG